MQLRTAIILTAGICLWAGCAREIRKERALGSVEYYPSWAFDAPFYYRPINDPTPLPPEREGDPIEYLCNQSMVHVERPTSAEPQAQEVERIGVYYTPDDGATWHRAGWFGRQQTHFPLQSITDGRIGVRFIGPEQVPAKTMPPFPHRWYIIDTTPPAIAVTVEPVRQEGEWYNPLETITVYWNSFDENPIENPVQVSVCWNWENKDRPYWMSLKADVEPNGSLVMVIPGEAEPEGFQIAVSAVDRLGNVGYAFSDLLSVSSAPLQSQVDEDQEDVESDEVEEGVEEGEESSETITGTQEEGRESGESADESTPRPAEAERKSPRKEKRTGNKPTTQKAHRWVKPQRPYPMVNPPPFQPISSLEPPALVPPAVTVKAHELAKLRGAIRALSGVPAKTTTYQQPNWVAFPWQRVALGDNGIIRSGVWRFPDQLD